MQSDDNALDERTLEAEANRLLREHGDRAIPLEYPFYAQSSLRQLSRRDEVLSLRELPGDFTRSTRAGALLDQLEARIDLTEENRALLEMLRAGYTTREIAERMHLTFKAVRRRLERMVASLRQVAADAGGYDRLLREMYAEAISVQRYSPEQHCHPGSEGCRRDGRCKFRWYLYQLSAQAEAE